MTYKPLKNPEDAYLVHLHEEWEIIYWCKKFGCSRQELKEAVAAVGNSPEHIALYFRRRQVRKANS